MTHAVLIRARELDIPGRAVIATDAEGVVIYWSDGAVALYGWSEAEAMGRNIVELTPGEISRGEAGEIMRLLRRGHSWTGNFVVHGKSGEPFTANVADFPVRDTAGELLGIIGVSHRV